MERELVCEICEKPFDDTNGGNLKIEFSVFKPDDLDCEGTPLSYDKIDCHAACLAEVIRFGIKEYKRALENATLPTPEQYNMAFRDKLTQPKTAPVRCAKCGTQMVYSNDCIMTSYPAMRYIHCPGCGQSDSMYV